MFESWEGVTGWSAGLVIGCKTTNGQPLEGMAGCDLFVGGQNSNMLASAGKSRAFSGIVKQAHARFNASVATVATAGHVYFIQACRRSLSFSKPEL